MLAVGDPAEHVLLAVTTALGLAMGAQAGAARHIAVKDVTTVVVTSTITGLAADSVFGARVDKHPWRRRAGAIALIGAGAAVGALALGRTVEAMNSVVTRRDPTGHAETNLVRAAAKVLTPETLATSTLDTSTEPCAMCAGAIYWSGIARVV